MFTWFKTLFEIVRNYPRLLNEVQRQGAYLDQSLIRHGEAIGRLRAIAESARKYASQCHTLIEERTRYHADVAAFRRDPSHVIVVGQYHGGDFVECYAIPAGTDIDGIVDHLKAIQCAKPGRVDAWPEFRRFIRRDL